MFKKIIAALMTVVGVFASVTAVKAETISTDGGSVSVPVTYTVDNSYFEVVIPATISVGTEATGFAITSTAMNIRPDETVQVSIASGCNEKGIVELERQGVAGGQKAATLDTYVTIDGTGINETNYIVGRFTDATGTDNQVGDVSMSGLTVTEDTQSGDYMATIVFKVDLVSA